MAFTCDLIKEPTIRAKLERISKIPSLVTTYCLPNIHRKDKLESPPQFVAATRGTIVPMLTAPAMNCGTSLFTTTLNREDFSPEFLKEFAKNLRSQIAPRIKPWQSFLGWLGLYERPLTKYDLSRSELEDFFLYGAKAAIKKYNLPKNELERIEYEGDVLGDEERKTINLKNLVPRSSYVTGRHELGYNFGGNHFLEFHYIERVENPEIAKAWGLHEGQIMLFYHGGGGHASYHLGRYFARREKNTAREKAILFVLKFLFHFTSWEGIKNFRARWYAYFSRTPFPETPLDSPEGKRLFQSIKIGLNYGYAFRVTLLKRINDALAFNNASASFVRDAAHNSIMEENPPAGGEGKNIIVHRQDAMRVFPDQPVMIMGLNNTLSYIGVGSQGAEKTLWSLTPSATQVIEQYIKDGKSHPENPPHVSLLSKRLPAQTGKNQDLIAKKHMTSEGLLDVVQQFEKEDIIKAVAYIRPLGSIKGH
jgi:tRNA-splicing ligase RtcB